MRYPYVLRGVILPSLAVWSFLLSPLEPMARGQPNAGFLSPSEDLEFEKVVKDAVYGAEVAHEQEAMCTIREARIVWDFALNFYAVRQVNKGRDVLPVFARALHSPIQQNVVSGLACLGELGPTARSSLHTIRGLLGSEDRRVREASIYAYGRICPDPQEITDRVPPLQSDFAEEVALAAGLTLWRLGGHSTQSKKIIASALRQEQDRKLRTKALYGLMSAPASAHAFKHDLKYIVDEERGKTQVLAAHLLAKNDASVRAVLVRLMQSPKDDYGLQVKIDAACALLQTKEHASDADSFLANIARSGDEEQQWYIADLLSRFPEMGPQTVQALVKMAAYRSKEIRSSRIRFYSIIALSQTRVLDNLARHAFTKALKDEKPAIRVLARYYLTR